MNGVKTFEMNVKQNDGSITVNGIFLLYSLPLKLTLEGIFWVLAPVL